jgi:DHA1 family multidrug resistance protein-like MFS transporter
MSRPYIPVVVEQLAGNGPGLASAIGLVAGTAALVGGIMSPLGGVIGDRIGFRPVLVTALAGAGAVLLLMPFAPSVASLALLAVVLGASTSTVSAMVFGLLATEIPSARRSATLNLVYLPLYAAGIVGPAVGAAVATGGGVAGPFLVAGAVLILGAAGILVRRTRTPDGPADESVVVAGTGFRPEG